MMNEAGAAPAGEMRAVCTACGSINRLPAGRPAAEGRCGHCHAPLFTGHPAEIDGAGFRRQIVHSTVPVLVDIWAPWCGPCRMMGPAFAEAARTLEPRVRLLKLNSDAEPQISAELGVRGIPALMLFSGGRRVAATAGAMTTAGIVRWVEQHLPA